MAPRRRLTIRWDRTRRAVAAGTLAGLAFTVLVPLPGSAATPRHFRDEFTSPGVYNGSNGSHPWNGPWVELGDDFNPATGAVAALAEPYCPDGVCLVIGGDVNPSASIVRGFNSAGSAAVSLTFDFERHVHGAGAGEVRLLATANGLSWDTLDVFSLAVDDGAPQTVSYDISAYAGTFAAVSFSLASSLDDSHMNIDNVEIIASDPDTPVFDTDLADRTDAEGDVVSIDAGATDPNGDTLGYSATGLPPGVSIDSSTGTITGTIGYTAAASSPYAVQVVVTDPALNSGVESFTWTVTNTNRDPSAADRSATVPEDDPTGVTIDLLDPGFVSDPDFDTPVLSAIDTTLVAGGAVVDNGDGTVTYTPAADFDQSDTFGYTVGDGQGGFATGNVTATVNGSPDDPVLDPPSVLSVAEETVATFTATADDPDTGAVLVYTLVDGPDPVPAPASIDSGTGVFSWLTDESDGPGTYRFTLRVTDDTSRFDEALVTVDVSESNRAPVLGPVADQVHAEGDTVALAIPVSDTDIPTGTLTFGAIGLPGGLSIDPATGEIAGVVSYDAAVGSPHAVTLTVQDSGAPPLADSIAFDWSVIDTNRAPVAGPPPANFSAMEGDSVTVTPSFSDADGDVLLYSAAGLPSGLGIDRATGVIAGVIAVGTAQVIPYSVVVTAVDPAGAPAVSAFTIGVSTPPVPSTTTTSTTTTTTTTATPTSTTMPPTTTSTTAAPPTTTSSTSTTAPVTSTTVPPVAITGTTSPPLPTTTVPTASTTIEEIAAPPSASPTSSSTVPELDAQVREEISKVKDGLLVEVGAASGSEDAVDGRRSLEPREGLAVTFVSAVETLRSHLLTSLLLGMGVAILLLLGIDEREDPVPV